jgi:hypothetical protein
MRKTEEHVMTFNNNEHELQLSAWSTFGNKCEWKWFVEVDRLNLTYINPPTKLKQTNSRYNNFILFIIIII